MIRRTTLLFVLLAAGLSLGLFTIKYRVQDLEQELVRISRYTLKERESIHVLKAEWSHLNDLNRLEKLARQHLSMQPLVPRQVATFADLSDRLTPPLHELDQVPVVVIEVPPLGASTQPVSGEGHR